MINYRNPKVARIVAEEIKRRLDHYGQLHKLIMERFRITGEPELALRRHEIHAYVAEKTAAAVSNNLRREVDEVVELMGGRRRRCENRRLWQGVRDLDVPRAEQIARSGVLFTDRRCGPSQKPLRKSGKSALKNRGL